jgi:hypothetical protein
MMIYGTLYCQPFSQAIPCYSMLFLSLAHVHKGTIGGCFGDLGRLVLQTAKETVAI